MRKHSEENTSPEAWLTLWLEDLRADRSPATLRRYRSVLRRFFAWYEQEEHRALNIHDLTPIALLGYKNCRFGTKVLSEG